MKENKRVFGYFEVLFDIFYLLVALIAGVYLISTAVDKPRQLAGLMALMLVGGDLFHLVPRIAVILTGDEVRWRRALGFGKLVTSITMTVFYVLLWHLGLLVYAVTNATIWTGLVYALAVLRLWLCFLPQNKWYDAQPPVSWGIYRNIPFLLMGAAVALLFGIYNGQVPGLTWMWLGVLLSFAFYLPVVIWASRQPKLGMLMLPKTCAYLWMIYMLLSL